jgi:two-component system nitrate/nitrite response regulator NarL
MPMPDYRALVRTILDAEEDFEVIGEACSGRECIEGIPEANPDVVFLDLNMPGMTGLETLPLLRKAAPTADVVILTTLAEPDTERAALELGATAFIRKPLNVFDLPGTVRSQVPSMDRRQRPRAA